LTGDKLIARIVTQEMLKENKTSEVLPGSTVFRHMPGFAAFIKKNYLVPYISEQINISREINLPMLKFFQGIPDDELIAMSVESHKEFLTAVENNTIRAYVEKSISTWMADGLGIIKRDEVTAEDITMAGYMRKRALIKFLPSYTSDVSEAIGIINEIDAFTVEGDALAFNVYIKLLKDRINENVLFSEILSNTTPGLNYIFDLSSGEIIYGNQNVAVFFDRTIQELMDMRAGIIQQLIHPDDIALTYQQLDKCLMAADKTIVSWECRLRNANGEFVWVKNYSSVFKRNSHGTPSQIVGIALDIEKEKNTAEKLLTREKQLLDAQAQANLGSFEWDISTGAIEATPQFAAIFEIRGTATLALLMENIHQDDRSRFREATEAAIKENDGFDIECRCTVNGTEKVIWAKGVVSLKNDRKVITGTVMDITGRHKMLERLLETERRYKQAEELSEAGTWIWNLVTGKIEWTDALYKIYGIETGSELTFERIMSCNHPEDHEKIKEGLRECLKTQRPSETYYHITVENGGQKILHAKSEVFADQNGKPNKMIGVIQDVTGRQQLIEKLQQSEELYKQAQALGHIGNWTWDMSTKDLVWSDEIYRIYELEPQSITSSFTLDQYNHPADEPLIRAVLKKAVETEESFDFSYRIILKSGKIKIVQAKGEIARQQEKPFKIIGTLQDITEQKTAEKQLKDYKDFIKKITDVTPSIIAAYSIRTGKYSYINDAIEKLLGYPADKVMEEGAAFLTSIVHPDDLPGIVEKNTAALAEANCLKPGDDEPIAEFKYRMQNKNGQYRWLHTYGTVFERNENGLVESVLNISVDITEQVAAEHSLYQKNLQLQQSNTSLEEYAYVASHDLKEPLRKISTFSDRLLTTQASLLTDEGKIYLNKIIDSSKRMQSMIGDLLSVSTILSNLDRQQCELRHILGEALIPLEHKIEESRAIIEVDDLPAISVVPSQFRQLFQNLVSNSLKFARSGVIPHIKISHKFLDDKSVARYQLIKANKYLQLRLEDNGIGFGNEYAIKIFAIFQRLHGKAEYDGTGIGLSICKKIVENHGGVIFAEGVINEGAVFTIILPL
jgi:PAS domain S-box-containing protein